MGKFYYVLSIINIVLVNVGHREGHKPQWLQIDATKLQFIGSFEYLDHCLLLLRVE
jgi:hypothetical protein